jgi:hypothetical protein
LRRWLICFRNLAQQRIDEIASEHRTDLRYLAGGAELIQARGERLLQGRRDRLNSPLLATLKKQPHNLLDEHGGTTPDQHKTPTFLRFPGRFRGLVLVIVCMVPAEFLRFWPS